MPGAQAERLRVPVADVNLLRVPDGVDDEAAIFVGDVLTTGWYAASIAEIAAEDSVAVVGLGPVGFCTVQAALALGARQVLALDRDPARLALAAAAGAAPIDATARHPVTAVAEATGGRGADIVIEAVGHPDAFETAAARPPRRPHRRRRHVYERDRGNAARRLVGSGDRPSLQRRVPRARVVGARMAEPDAGRLDPMPLDVAPAAAGGGLFGYELFAGERRRRSC